MRRSAILFLLVFFYSAVSAQIQGESGIKDYSINYESSSSESSSQYFNIINESELALGESKEFFYSISSSSGINSESLSKYYSIGVPVKVIQNQVVNNKEKIERNSTTIIESTNNVSNNTYVLIIGNEDYKSYQTGLSSEQNVEFALNDAKLFKEVCCKTLGVPNDNIIYLENASFVKMKQALSQIELICKHSKNEPIIIFYYSGHGLPDEHTKIPYLIPVDVSGSTLDYAIGLPDVYESLTKYATEKVVVILDACFTGEARNVGLVASRGVKVIPMQQKLSGNLVVFSASSSNQSSKAYKEKGHGMFTYFFTKKLIDSEGKIKLGMLDEYLFEKVTLKSILINKTEQVPHTNISPEIELEWKNWDFY